MLYFRYVMCRFDVSYSVDNLTDNTNPTTYHKIGQLTSTNGPLYIVLITTSEVTLNNTALLNVIVIISLFASKSNRMDKRIES